jgi:phage tail sheath protein FI
MFIGGGMSLFNYVAFAISSLVAVEVVVWLVSTRGYWSSVSMPRIKAVVNVAGKVSRSMEPGAGSNKHAADEPIGPIVAVGCAVIWSIREVSIRAYRSYPDADRDLG